MADVVEKRPSAAVAPRGHAGGSTAGGSPSSTLRRLAFAGLLGASAYLVSRESPASRGRATSPQGARNVSAGRRTWRTTSLAATSRAARRLRSSRPSRSFFGEQTWTASPSRAARPGCGQHVRTVRAGGQDEAYVFCGRRPTAASRPGCGRREHAPPSGVARARAVHLQVLAGDRLGGGHPAVDGKARARGLTFKRRAEISEDRASIRGRWSRRCQSSLFGASRASHRSCSAGRARRGRSGLRDACGRIVELSAGNKAGECSLLTRVRHLRAHVGLE